MPAANVIEMALVFLLLLVTGVQDFQKKEIDVRMTLAIGAVGLLYRMMADRDLKGMLFGAAIGVALWILSKATGGAIGAGDALVLVVTGLLLGFDRNLELMFTGLIFCGIVGLFLLVILKADRRKEIPFVPFLLLAFAEMTAVEYLL